MFDLEVNFLAFVSALSLSEESLMPVGWVPESSQVSKAYGPSPYRLSYPRQERLWFFSWFM